MIYVNKCCLGQLASSANRSINIGSTNISLVLALLRPNNGNVIEMIVDLFMTWTQTEAAAAAIAAIEDKGCRWRVRCNQRRPL